MEENSQRKVLEMLSEGRITVDEAKALLEKLGENSTEEDSSLPAPREGGRPGAIKYLRVIVDPADGDKVNVRIPLSLIKTGIKLKALVPGDVANQMSSHGVDLSQLSELDGDELIEALRDLQVDVDSANGDEVRVFTE